MDKYQNVKCVKADLGDADSCAKAVDGCHGVFLVTNFWAPGMTVEKEIDQGKNIIAACKDKNVKHLVWSGLLDSRNHKDWMTDDVKAVNGGAYFVPHYDGKGMVSALMDAQDFFAVTHVNAAFYMQNFLTSFNPQNSNNSWQLPFGENECALTSTVDIGKAAAAVFLKGVPVKADGKWPVVNVASDKLTWKAIAEKWSAVSGVETGFKHVANPDWIKFMTGVFSQSGMPEEAASTMSQDLGNMFMFQSGCKVYKDGMDPAEFRKLVADAQSLDDFLKENEAAIKPKKE